MLHSGFQYFLSFTSDGQRAVVLAGLLTTIHGITHDDRPPRLLYSPRCVAKGVQKRGSVTLQVNSPGAHRTTSPISAATPLSNPSYHRIVGGRAPEGSAAAIHATGLLARRRSVIPGWGEPAELRAADRVRQRRHDVGQAADPLIR